MPMTKAGMSSAISAALVAENGAAADSDQLQAFCDAIADAIVNYIQANAQVPLGIAVATTGSAAAQTGATTAPGTVT